MTTVGCLREDGMCVRRNKQQRIERERENSVRLRSHPAHLAAQVLSDADELGAACDQSLNGVEPGGVDKQQIAQIDAQRPGSIRADADQFRRLRTCQKSIEADGASI